ncbi:MAG: hypothetical protein KGK07_14145 [Chloroflexota bacterium]|nr:hypothetical protein [Chloroflexota bacterium]
MKELVRTDLPELLVAGERARAFVARSSLPFALLAGIGADRIAGDVLRTIAVAVLSVVQLQNAPRPYDVQQVIGPAAGMIVARRAGGRAGALAYVGYSALTVALRWVDRFLSCNAASSRGEPGPVPFCPFTDLLTGALPLVAALAIGALIATLIGDAPRTGTNALLEGAGAYVAFSALVMLGATAFVVSAYGVSPQQVAFIVAVTAISGVLAGATIAFRSNSPLRTALLLAFVFVVTWIYPLGAGQFEMAARADWAVRPELLLFAVPLLDVVTIPLVARLVASHSRLRDHG